MTSHIHTTSEVETADDSSSTCSQRLQRKRQRIESSRDDEDGNCGNDGSAIQHQNSKINQYNGWVVPESNYRIPTLSTEDDGDDLTPERFYQNYVRRRRPVVIRGKLPSELEQLEKWRTGNGDMLQRAGDVSIMVEKRSNHNDSFGKGNEVSISFRRFMELIEDGDTMHYLTTQDVAADHDGRPDLMSSFMKKLQGRDGDAGVAFPLRPKIAGNLVPQNINLWIGNSKTGASSGLHHDYHDNIYIVLRGTKRFRLFSPADTENMYTRGKLVKVHSNGRINYDGEITTAYGADPESYAAALAAKLKEEAEERLAAAEKAVEEGKPGAEEELERAEAMLDEAMEAILDAETDGINSDEEEEFCLESAKEEDVEGIDIDAMSSSSEEDHIDDDSNADSNADNNCRIVDKTIKNPNNFSKADPAVLDDREKLKRDFPKMLNARSAFCECNSGDILYLPASWFHEVTSFSGATGDKNTKGHMAFNYWFHPPDAEDDFEHPYTTDFWPNDFRDRSKCNKKNLM